jgi:hypothetical protein
MAVSATTTTVLLLLLLTATSVELTYSQDHVELWQEAFVNDVGYGIGVGMRTGNVSFNGWTVRKAKNNVAEQAVFGVGWRTLRQ